MPATTFPKENTIQNPQKYLSRPLNSFRNPKSENHSSSLSSFLSPLPPNNHTKMASSSRTLRPRPEKNPPVEDPIPSDQKRKAKPKAEKPAKKPKLLRRTLDPECIFVGESVPDSEARRRWPSRYQTEEEKTKNSGSTSSSSKENEDEELLFARCHYLQAKVDGCVYNINDSAYIKSEDDAPDYIGRIVEFFETPDHRPFFTAQWFFKAEDTVMKEDLACHINKKRVFLSELKNENPLDCILSKLKIVHLSAQEETIPKCDYFYNMSYSLDYSTFANLPPECASEDCKTSSIVSIGASTEGTKSKIVQPSHFEKSEKPQMTLLDVYAGCGAMSAGLCLGASRTGVDLATRWAVDFNKHACRSLGENHKETHVRNESADDFLALLKEWTRLCKKYSLLGTKKFSETKGSSTNLNFEEKKDICMGKKPGVFEVEKLTEICYGDPNSSNKPGLHFKVRWKGYGPKEDTWEPLCGLRKCEQKIKEFVTCGYKSSILPLPGDVDVICGGPPCQGISGHNRFRNYEKPLDDPKNHQLVVFMDLVEYLRPRFALMENVVDMLKFADGFLGRYALARLVSMNYQARLGMMVAGSYGLPQFRMRVFLWGALPSERLPQFPLPTHDVVTRGGTPKEFERNLVAFEADQNLHVKKALLLGDAISDLPQVSTHELRDAIPHVNAPATEFQRFIRCSKEELMGMDVKPSAKKVSKKGVIFDHRPLRVNDDDYARICHVPKKKGANFRDFPGVIVGANNVVEWDPKVKRQLLPSKKPLVPDYAMSFRKGTSSKPFGRLWWDETVSTVVTRAEPHNQVVIHPEQDRVLSVRENARLQGFPDYYRLYGPIKERYKQVGNAVAVPVSRALGYSLGLASQGNCTEEPLFTLPENFSSPAILPFAGVERNVLENEDTII